MEKIVIVILAFCLSELMSYSQNIYTRYYPMQVGNVYVYQYHRSGFPPTSGKIRKYIEKDTIVNSHIYFVFREGTNTFWRRTDSTSGSHYIYATGSISCLQPTPYERLRDSLALLLHNTYVCLSATYTCSDSGTGNYFGQIRSYKNIGYSSIGVGNGARFVMDIGPFSIQQNSQGSSYSETLLGCVVGGVVYGDTSFFPTGVNQISTEVAEEFNLYQNYPNPFNPETIIKFSLPLASFVKLIIYDAIGREISVIASELLKAGVYESLWDASNFPSGVYFYELSAGEFKERKKMVLIK